MVAARLAVSVLVIVCTATGAPPPTGTAPTWICRLEAMGGFYDALRTCPAAYFSAEHVRARGRGARRPGRVSATEVADVVADAVNHQEREQHDPDGAVAVHGPK